MDAVVCSYFCCSLSKLLQSFLKRIEPSSRKWTSIQIYLYVHEKLFNHFEILIQNIWKQRSACARILFILPLAKIIMNIGTHKDWQGFNCMGMLLKQRNLECPLVSAKGIIVHSFGMPKAAGTDITAQQFGICTLKRVPSVPEKEWILFHSVYL